MKTTIQFVALCLCALACLFTTACTEVEKPNPAYSFPEKTLEKTDQLSTIMRIPLEATQPGLDYKVSDPAGIRLAESNGELLQPVIRQLVSEVQAGKIPMYNPDDFESPLEFETAYKGIEELKLEETAAALSHTVEIKCEFISNGEEVKREVSGVRLVWRDAGGKFPEKNIGFVKVSDLLGAGFSVQLEERDIPLMIFLNGDQFEMFPIQTAAGTMNAMGVRTLEEAYVIKEDLYAGRFEREPYQY